MKIKSIALAILAIAAIFLLIFFTFKSRPTPSLSIGFIGNLTGEYASYTVNFREGIELAQSLHNANPATRTKVDITYEDDAFESKRGILAFQKLTTQDKVKAIINVTTPTIGAIKPDINKQHIPTIQFGIEPDGSQNDYVFTIYPGGIDTEQEVAKQAAADLALCKKPILVYSQVDAMISQKEFFKKGYSTSLEEHVLSNTLDSIKNDSLKISTLTAPDCIVMETTPLDGANFIKYYLSYSKVTPTFFFSSVFHPAIGEYEKVLGTSMSKIGNSIVPIVNTYASDDFKQLFKQKYSRDPGPYAEFGFDAFHVLVDAYASDPETWIARIQQTDLRGASSHIRYNSTGSVTPEIKIMRLADVLK